jgi:NAD(P)-dependent dehydrogenase (short-subunit alcohol dehydrogenase family)
METVKRQSEMNKSNKTWLITGCSSGLGRAFAQEVLKTSYNAVVTSRNPKDIRNIIENYPETALGLALDVTNTEQVKEAVKQAEAKFGRIDVLINNAGFGYRSAVEEAYDNWKNGKKSV